MYSSYKPAFTSDTAFETQPLHPGHYFLVDISDLIDVFYQASPAARMEAVAEGAEMTQYDMVDVELTEIIPCISALHDRDCELDKHIEDLLDEGVKRIASDFYQENPDIHLRNLANTAEQNEHASAVFELGQGLRRRFEQHGLYNHHGELVAEYDTLLDEGVIALRSR